MTAKKVFVTGAAGQTGVHTVKWLSEHGGAGVDVWAGIRKGEESKQEACLKTVKSVHPVPLDAGEKSNLVEKLRDTNDLFIVPPSHEDKVKHAINYIDAAKEAGVKFVLLLSMNGVNLEGYSWGNQFAQLEEHLKKNIENWCIIRSSFYMQNLCLYKAQIKQGYLPLPIGNGKFAPVDMADIGMVAGSIIKNCEKHKGKIYEIQGPECLSGHQMAKYIGSALNQEVDFKDISVEEATRVLNSNNVPGVEVKGLVDFYNFAKKGEFDKPVSDDFNAICNCPATSLTNFVTRCKACFD